MRIERISENEFSIYVTFADLFDRGYFMNDLWQDTANLKLLFSTMMYEASERLGFTLEGVLLIQVQFMQTEGMHVFVTQEKQGNMNNEYLEMQVSLGDSDNLLFAFSDFEYLLQASTYLIPFSITGGRVYYYEDGYYMMLMKEDLAFKNTADIIAIMSEYSKPSMLSACHLLRHGKVIFEQNAIQQVKKHFL